LLNFRLLCVFFSPAGTSAVIEFLEEKHTEQVLVSKHLPLMPKDAVFVPLSVILTANKYLT
jgi:hypothetical protein